MTSDRKINVEYQIVAGKHPHRLIPNSLPTDPSYGLGVRIYGKAAKAYKKVSVDEDWEEWLTNTSTSRKNVFPGNTIVDFKNGVDQDTINTPDRRSFNLHELPRDTRHSDYTTIAILVLEDMDLIAKGHGGKKPVKTAVCDFPYPFGTRGELRGKRIHKGVS